MMRRQAPLQNILFNFAMAKTPEGKRDLKTSIPGASPVAGRIKTRFQILTLKETNTIV